MNIKRQGEVNISRPSAWTPWHETAWGNEDNALPILNLSIRWRRMVGFTTRPFYNQGGISSTHGWTPDIFCTPRRKRSLPLSGTETRLPVRSASM
jgi:hypothetical protein